MIFVSVLHPQKALFLKTDWYNQLHRFVFNVPISHLQMYDVFNLKHCFSKQAVGPVERFAKGCIVLRCFGDKKSEGSNQFVQ